MNRRDFLKSGAGFYIAASAKRLLADPVPGGSLPPGSIPKYATPLVVPQNMPAVSTAGGLDYYEVSMRSFKQQILPPMSFSPTTVFGYGSTNNPASFGYPAKTIEARVNRPVRVKWTNGLVDGSGNFVPHFLPIDPTLHWANPPGPRDMEGEFKKTPGPYTGPVPMVPHLHGGHTFEDSDGYPEAWFLPTARNIPGSYFRVGSHYDELESKFRARVGLSWPDGSAIYQYTNDQRGATLWYHDHVVGMTRVNVYAGTAGFYLLRGPEDDLLAPLLPSGKREIPIVVQDRSFNNDGSLFFPDSREFFDGFTGPYIPRSDIPPIWNPEFFGNTMVVNGRTWPFLEVEPRRYRFRVLNGCNSRFLILKIASAPPVDGQVSAAALPFWQIGGDGGYLQSPVMRKNLLIAPAERNDVIVDFSNLPPGMRLYLINEGPDEPFGGGQPGVDFASSDAASTGQVMEFRVVARTSQDTSAKVENLGALPGGAAALAGALPTARVRRLSLNEFDSDVLPGVGPRVGMLGILDAAGNPVAKAFMDPITENVRLGDTEVWEIYNFTADAHPIHVHLVQFQVVSRQGLVTDADGISAPPARLDGPPMAPEAWERGPKDTVIAYPGQVTRIKARFDRAGLYVWHCHILDHEDHDMMRPYRVG